MFFSNRKQGKNDMALIDSTKDKILKLGSKQKLVAILKHVNNPNEDIRIAVATALGMTHRQWLEQLQHLLLQKYTQNIAKNM